MPDRWRVSGRRHRVDSVVASAFGVSEDRCAGIGVPEFPYVFFWLDAFWQQAVSAAQRTSIEDRFTPSRFWAFSVSGSLRQSLVKIACERRRHSDCISERRTMISICPRANQFSESWASGM